MLLTLRSVQVVNAQVMLPRVTRLGLHLACHLRLEAWPVQYQARALAGFPAIGLAAELAWKCPVCSCWYLTGNPLCLTCVCL
jgi:hypothetical protein